MNGYITGYKRRFWQASPDHRGTPEQPGRVLTLVPGSEEDRVHGSAFRVPAHAKAEIMESVRAHASYVEQV